MHQTERDFARAYAERKARSAEPASPTLVPVHAVGETIHRVLAGRGLASSVGVTSGPTIKEIK
jgi:hypothetical protein